MQNKNEKYISLKIEERKLMAKISIIYNQYCKGDESVYNQLERLRLMYSEAFNKLKEARAEAI